ncbi:AraC family transcriptional regulator, partial [Pseudomonas aeruginosa]
FADPSNFFRAFRRWFGCTPNEYRARAGAIRHRRCCVTV